MANRKIFRVKRTSTKPDAGTQSADTLAVSEPNGVIEPEIGEPTDGINDDSSEFPTEFIAPASIGESGNSSEGSQPGKRRGRKPGSKNRKQTQTENDLTTVVLLSIHTMMASFSKCPELELEKEEAERLGAAVNQVASFYTTEILGEEVRAWIMLATVAGSIYGPRTFAILHRGKKETQQEQQPTFIMGETDASQITQ